MATVPLYPKPGTPGAPTLLAQPKPGQPYDITRTTTALAAPKPVAAPRTPTAPVGTDPFTAMGGGVWTGYGWVPKGHPEAAKAGAQTPGATTPGAPPLAPGTTATTPQTYGGPTVQSAFRDQLLKQLAQDPNAVTLQDPALAAQTRAFSDAQQRAIERQQQEAAEQGFAGGNLGTGAYQQQLAGLQQQRGESEAQFGAGLLGEARNQRMQELYDALGLAKESIAGGEDYGLREAALKAQTALGQGDLALRGQLGRGQLGLGLLQALLGDRQAANQLGLNAGIAGMGFNQSAMQQLLQGMR